MIPYTKSRHKEISVITPIKYLYTAKYATYIKVLVNINGKRTVTIIDLEATDSFILERLVFFNKLLTREKKEQYEL